MSRQPVPAERLDWKAVGALGIRRLINDSRAVRPGDTFVAYPGQSRDGREFIPQALARGAASVLWERAGFRWNPRWRAPNLGVRQLRRNAGEIASRMHGRPSARLHLIGVTGTNGKTTCSQWIAQALTRCGRRCAVIGTLGYGVRAPLRPLANTTPDALWLHAQLAEFARRGAQAVAMEVSSIGLDQDRVAGVEFDVALFTNLSRDHLEYHRTMRRYGEAKACLFAWQTLRHAVVNLDDDFGAALARGIGRPGLKVIGYGFTAACGAPLARVTGSNLVTSARGLRQAHHAHRRSTASLATAASENGRRAPRISWYSSCPLPASSTMSPRRASCTARRIAARRSGSIAIPPPARRTPPTMSSMICRGSSPRGLSEVITTRSASAAATRPICGRLPRSRSPPQPNTQIRREV